MNAQTNGVPAIEPELAAHFDEPSDDEAPPPAPTDGPTSEEPLRGLAALTKIAIVGRARIVELAKRPIVYVWDGIASAGQILVVAAGPGAGKTTVMGLWIAARANLGAPVDLLGHRVTPAPRGQYIVLIEAEHGEVSTARKLVRSLRAMGIDDEALERVVIIARKELLLGSPAWLEIVRMTAAGIVSDILIDTLARVAPSDANDEAAQTAAFAAVAQALEAAPTHDKPIAWVNAHLRKVEGTPSLADVGGSMQRTGQADTVILLEATRGGDGQVLHTRAIFPKLREDPDEYPRPVTFTVARSGPSNETRYTCDVTPADDGTPLEERILAVLAVDTQTKSGLSKILSRSNAHIDAALTNLFSARRIETVEKLVSGRRFKAFRERKGAPDLAPDSRFRGEHPTQHPTSTRLDVDAKSSEGTQ